MPDLSLFIRNIPDFPRPGIQFKDITPLLQDARAFRAAIDELCGRFAGLEVDVICAAEARGFLIAAPMARQMGCGLVPMRKPGKLPWRTLSCQYALEYGNAALHMHADAFRPGQRALLIDDLLATGGTVAAMADLVRQGQGIPAAVGCLVELTNLNPRQRLPGLRVESLLSMEG
jgi:adenine phosphoribosyltransferase